MTSYPPYLNALDQIYHNTWSLAKLARLETLRDCIRTLWPEGHPTQWVSVTGTSGKTSTTRFIHAALNLHSRAASLTGPHLFDWRERFTLPDGTNPTQRELATLWDTTLQPFAIQHLRTHKETLGFQELNLLTFLLLCDRHNVQFGIAEVGVGGRYDTTRALDAPTTALTNIGPDHIQRLGAEPWQRTLEKGGLVAPHGALFTTENNLQNQHILRELCAHTHATYTYVPHNPKIAEAAPWDGNLTNTIQHNNASLAFAVAQHIAPNLDADHVFQALDTLPLMGRLSKHEGVWVDVAHNPDKLQSLVDHLQSTYPNTPFHIVAGLSGKRDVRNTLALLAPVAASIALTSAGFKGQDPGELLKSLKPYCAAPLHVFEKPRDALLWSKSHTDQSPVLITGSTFVIDQALNPDAMLRHTNAVYGWRTKAKHTTS